jgi:hypothetical protein
MKERPEPVGDWRLRAASGSLLAENVRRDVADLNRRFLHLLLEAATHDARARWPVHGPAGSGTLDAASIDAISWCPFTLFELNLAGVPPSSVASPDVQVRDDSRPPVDSLEMQCQLLAHGALLLAWRLADTSPLSLRLALGLPAAAELLMNETRVMSLAALARTPHLLRTRWLDHPVFWRALVRAGREGDRVALGWLHCLGITLLVGDLGLRDFDAGRLRSGPARARR